MKRLLSALLVLALVLSLAACGGQLSIQPTTTPSQTTGSADPTNPTDPSDPRTPQTPRTLPIPQHLSLRPLL